MDFRPLNETQRRQLIAALRGNAESDRAILMDRRDTSFAGSAFDVTDEEVSGSSLLLTGPRRSGSSLLLLLLLLLLLFTAIRSVPCHY